MTPNPIQFNDDAFSTDDFEENEDGDKLRFIVRVPLSDPVQGVPGDCESDSCFDPIDTSGEEFYEFLLDFSEPEFFVHNPADGILFGPADNEWLDDNEWWMFTNNTMSGGLPDIAFSVADNVTGAPLDDVETTYTRDDGDDIEFDRDPPQGGHLANYTIDHQAGESFGLDTSTLITLVLPDLAGNSAEGELRVNMDETLPEVQDDESHLRRIGSDAAPASLGERVRVHVNATDVAGDDVETPEELLTVEARLVADNRTSVGDWHTIPWNETEGHYLSHDVRLPTSGWDSGENTTAEVRVTDVVGNRAGPVPIQDNITVDADIPVIEPVAPLGAGEELLFSADEDIDFTIRATDAGDGDDWDGEDTEDTDGLGINFDTVQLHYRLGEDGSRTTVVLEPQEENHTFRVPRGFEELVEVYHYYSAEDHAGNRVTYPGPSDPHREIEAAGNDGRYLLLHTDRVGPDIEPSRDHTFLGGDGDHEYRFNITDDPGVGLDDTTPQLNWRIEGEVDYTTVNLTESQVEHDITGETFTTFTGSIPHQTEEGTIIEYFVEAEDELGNAAALGSGTAPRTTEIDLTPPTVTVTSPSVASENRFNVTWEGEDERSGVRDYSLQFRIAGGNWHDAPGMERTALTSWEVCAATDVTYEFRVSARDNAGNERAFPEVADASTDVNAPDSCAQPPTISLTSPSDGDTLSGEVDIEWSAISTVFPDDVTVRIEVGGTVIAEGLDEAGEYRWNTAVLDPDEPCFADGSRDLRVVAVDPANAESAEEVTVTLQNGITNTDCEDRFPSTSNPFGSEPGEFNPLYLLVVVAFVGLAAVFAVGMARRW